MLKNLKSNKIILILLIIIPFLDYLTSIFAWNQKDFLLGTLIKGFIFLVSFLFLWKNNEKKLFLFLSFYFIVHLATHYFFGNSFLNEMTFLLQIFYLPFLILFFVRKNELIITDGFLCGIFFIYLFLYLTPFLFGMGHNIGEIYAGKDIYLSYFYSGNELVGVFLTLMPVVFHYLYTRSNYLFKIGGFVLIGILSLLLSTKALILGILLTILYFVFLNFKVILKNKKFLILVLAFFFFGISIFLMKSSFIHNVLEAINFYQINSFDAIFSFSFLDNVLLSNRLTFLQGISEIFLHSNMIQILFGLGRTTILMIKDVEMDFFDIFFAQGIIGFFFYFSTFIYAITRKKIKSYYFFGFMLCILVSFFTGHILTSPMVCLWIACLFANHEPISKKKKVLLVSNMYPSKEWKHYGSFVKNSRESLEKGQMNVTVVSMKKQDKKWKKLVHYMLFYIKAFGMSVFGNYDYFYVHFISHSTFPVWLSFVTSKHTKLILNVHGNDIVADYDYEKKNERISAFFLKFADKILCPSLYFHDILINFYHVPQNKIFIYPSGGIDFKVFHPMNKIAACESLKLDNKKVYYGYIGRIEKDKGWDTFLEMVHEFDKNHLIGNRHFIILGSGMETPNLEKLIKKWRIEVYITICPFVSQKDLVLYYNAFDAFLFPTKRKSESLGLVGLEAMACQTFVIGNNTYGPREFLIDEETGLVTNDGNGKSLMDTILKFEKLSKKEKERILKNAFVMSCKYDIALTNETLLQIFGD